MEERKLWVKRLTEAYLETHESIVDSLKTILPETSHMQFICGEDYAVFVPNKPMSERLPMLCAHSDTVFISHLKRKEIVVKHKKGVTYIKANNPLRGCGGDDRNGIAILLQIAQEKPNDFIFAVFNHEESGLLGSTLAVEVLSPLFKRFVSCYIGLDRYGDGDVAIYGCEAPDLLKLFKWTYGSVTDVSVLAEATDISCINIPVGYHNAHTSKEYTVVEEVIRAYQKVTGLPIELWGKVYKREERYMGYLDDWYFPRGRGWYNYGYGRTTRFKHSPYKNDYLLLDSVDDGIEDYKCVPNDELDEDVIDEEELRWEAFGENNDTPTKEEYFRLCDIKYSEMTPIQKLRWEWYNTYGEDLIWGEDDAKTNE